MPEIPIEPPLPPIQPPAPKPDIHPIVNSQPDMGDNQILVASAKANGTLADKANHDNSSAPEQIGHIAIAESSFGDSTKTENISSIPEIKFSNLAPTDRLHEGGSMSVIQDQWRKFWTIRNTELSVQPISAPIVKNGFLIHNLVYDPKNTQHIFESGILSGEMGYGSKPLIPEDSETHFCADFFRNTHGDLSVSEYYRKIQERDPLDSIGKKPIDSYLAPKTKVLGNQGAPRISIVIDPDNPIISELIEHSSDGVAFSVNGENDPLAPFIDKFPNETNKHVAVLAGIPANAINYLVVGGIDSDAIAVIEKQIQDAKLQIPIYSVTGERLAARRELLDIDTTVLSSLQASQNPEQTFSEFSQKEELTWYERANLCTWNITHQQPNKYLLTEVESRENALLASVNTFTPEQIVHIFTENLPRSFKPNEVLQMMGSIPFEKLNLDVDSYRKLSAYAITQLQKTNVTIDPTVENPLSVQIARSLSKRGLLDWSRFLNEQDVQAIQQQLEQRYQKLLIGGMNGKAHGLSKPEGSYDRSYTPLKISQASQEILGKYFDSSAIGIQSDQIASTANPGYLSELNGIVVGTPDIQRRFATSGFPMYQLAEAHQPAHDLRLNFNFTGDQTSIIDQAKIVSKLISNAQIHGVPITSKLTTADDQAKYAGRILLYTDHAQLETLLEDIHKRHLTALTPDIQTPTDWNVQMNLTADGSISVRGTGEGFGNNTDILRSSFSNIKNSIEQMNSAPPPTQELSIISPIKNQVLDEQQFAEFRRSNGFINGFHGTWESQSEQTYLYVKPDFLLDSEKQAQDALRIVRLLTVKGALYPNTEWGTFQTKNNQYQLFAITRRLNRWDPKLNGQDGRQTVKTNIGESNSYQGILDEDSHVLEWMKRVDPDYDPASETEVGLTPLLNIFEASHSDNWAWDENGRLYPIDIEVISVTKDYSQQAINNWIRDNPSE